jgi:hypothetical protein
MDERDAIAAEVIALRKRVEAAEWLSARADALLAHVEDVDIPRPVPGQCTVCHGFRMPLHRAIAAYRATGAA